MEGDESQPLRLSSHTETKSQLSDGIVLYEPNPIKLEFAGPTASRTQLQWRHGSWRVRRLRVWESLIRLNKSDRRLERFANCGACPRVEVRDDGNEVRVVSDKCRDRTCVICGGERAGVIVENLAAAMEMQKCRFVTLTLKHSHAPVADQVTRLYDSFAKLRRRDFFKGHVDGGAAFLELKWSDKDGLAHPHLHLIITGDYVDQRRLSSEWLAVTGDSSYVFINSIGDLGKVARYVTKYVTKPLDPSCYATDDRLDECISALGGRRLCLTWGSWRGLKLTEPPPDSHKWVSAGSPDALWNDMREGREGAAALAVKLCRACPALARYFDLLFHLHPAPPPLDDPPDGGCPF